LVCQQENGLEAELAVAKVEQILKGGTEEVEHHGVVITFGSKPSHEWNSDATCECLVDFGFILELRVLCLY
jgi:hypothetical protein